MSKYYQVSVEFFCFTWKKTDASAKISLAIPFSKNCWLYVKNFQLKTLKS